MIESPAQACSATVVGQPSAYEEKAVDVKRLKVAMREHLRMVWRILRRCGLEPRDADEAAQDVFLILSRRLDDVAIQAQKSFIVQTALRVAADRRRSVNRFPEVELDCEARSPTANVDELVALRRARILLDEALASLTDEQRAVFVLVEMEQLTAPEVAEALGIPSGTVASRLRAARHSFDGAVRRIHVRERTGEP